MSHESQRLRAITHSAVDAIVSADRFGVITDWNPAAQRIFGYTAHEAIGQSLELLMPVRFRRQHTRGIERVGGGGPSRLSGSTLQVSGLRKNGEEFPLELSLARWSVGDEAGFTGIMRDVSQRSSIERELTRMFSLVCEVLEGHVLNGRYRLEQKLGASDLSVLYEATELEHGTPVAIKLLRPPAGRSQSKWVGKLGCDFLPVHAVEHPYAVEVLEQGRSDLALPYVVTELLSGESMRERIDRGGLPTIGECLTWVEQIGAALGAAHDAGLIHGNVSMDSVYLHEPPNGEPTIAKIADFGLRAFEQTILEASSPGESARSPQDDLRQLTDLLFELLAGSPSFEGPDSLEWSSKLSHLPRALIRPLDVLLSRATAATRPKSTLSFIEALAYTRLELPSEVLARRVQYSEVSASV